MLIVIASLLILFPPVGLIIGILLVLFVIILNLHLTFLKIIIEDNKLIRQSIFGNETIDITDIKKLKSMKVIGTVANSPITIRKVVLDTENGEKTLRTLTFRWYEILDLLEAIDLKIR